MTNRVGLFIFKILKETKWPRWIFEPECCWVKINAFSINIFLEIHFTEDEAVQRDYL